MTEPTAATFKKNERIVSRKLMERLFCKGSNNSASVFPLRSVYMLTDRQDGQPALQVLISVSKRHFKRAVKRNRVKRQIREAYRHQKHCLAERIPENKQMAVAFIWLSDELMDSKHVENSLKRLLEKIAGRL